MLVSEVMSKRIISLSNLATALDAAKLMSIHNIGALPVLEKGQVKGIITDRDITLRCVAEGRDPNQVKATDIMTTGAATVSTGQTVEEAAGIMSREQIRRLPVIENGHLAGMLSIADVARIRHGEEISEAIYEISKP